MELEIKHTNVFTRNLNAINNDVRFLINQGGSRSGKTWAIIQMLIYLCYVEEGIKISIVRKSFPSLRGSVMEDWLNIMEEYGIYNVKNHNKTDNRYKFDNGSVIEFFSIDDSKKVRGRKRDICYVNEANELTFEEYLQLNMRTNNSLIFDFNPSDNESWLYDLISDKDAKLIKSTYKDNIYLGSVLLGQIENLINIDENYYKIYALGERPIPHTRIYTHFKEYNHLPDDLVDEVIYGLDFGYNHNTVLTRLKYSDGEIYIEEVIYKNKLTSGDLIQEMDMLGIERTNPIYADYARPEIIEDLRRAGYLVKEADKSVKDGIMSVKMNKCYIKDTSLNTLDEVKKYTWKTKGETILDEPVKMWDDAMDAIRYAIHTHKKKQFNAAYTRWF